MTEACGFAACAFGQIPVNSNAAPLGSPAMRAVARRMDERVPHKRRVRHRRPRTPPAVRVVAAIPANAIFDDCVGGGRRALVRRVRS